MMNIDEHLAEMAKSEEKATWPELIKKRDDWTKEELAEKLKTTIEEVAAAKTLDWGWREIGDEHAPALGELLCHAKNVVNLKCAHPPRSSRVPHRAFTSNAQTCHSGRRPRDQFSPHTAAFLGARARARLAVCL
jgi:hypothetical protein